MRTAAGRFRFASAATNGPPEFKAGFTRRVAPALTATADPDGVNGGDLVVLVASTNNAAVSFSVAAGWSAPVVAATSGTATFSQSWLWVGSGSLSRTVTASESTTFRVTALAFRRALSGLAVAASATANGTAVTIPSTTATDGSLSVAVATGTGNSISHTGPAGWDVIAGSVAELPSVGGNNGPAFAASSLLRVVDGATGAATMTRSGSGGWIGHHVILD